MMRHDTKPFPSFKDMMNDVVDYGSCCECGSCVVVCPYDVIHYIDGKPKQVAKPDAAFDYCAVSEGIGCDVCASVCPRLTPREGDLYDRVFGGDRPFSENFGVYRSIFAARCKDERVLQGAQDGGVVTAILAWALRQGFIEGAVVSALDGGKLCQPVPKVVTTEEELIASAGSWYTYCPNNLALRQAREQGLSKVAFVGTPCQITPLRKMQYMDDAHLEGPKKKAKNIERQKDHLHGFATNVVFSIGLLCSEVFTYEGLMEQKIEQEMGIPLSEVEKFNVKGKVLIYKKDREVVELNLKEAQQHARPECHHCGDFSAELADISCGGVGAMGWTITIARTKKGEEILTRLIEQGVIETRPIEEFERSWKILKRLTRLQRERVPVPPWLGGDGD
ncbi:MAG: Coenzyme F420 hydrogenase/dehydrogenase, beta subunit C-terminal domain [Candidatus Tectomicrobia bacterium]|nr:Coenzyme F420 hydrogenase/dehydrogenase, beta subunit C-terminal domain [Candidatus Tectomicrobia bacterium]